MENILSVGASCVGCGCCALICPVKAISMEKNEEGFLYPKVGEDKCIKCGLCLKKCSQAVKRNERSPIDVYALKSKEHERVFHSASAGVSDLAVGVVLKEGGIAFGAAYDDDFVVTHILVDSDEGRRKIQSSKYVQSNLRDTFCQAKQELEKGTTVLFTGPCQIDSLYTYLGREYDSLYTIDLICHGVPSPEFFRKYILNEERKMGGKLVSYNFRSKEKKGWGTQEQTKTKTKTLRLTTYGRHFMDGNCYRECCYQCHYANLNRVGDITIGDFWAVGKYYPQFYSQDGVSTVFINSEKGKRLLEKIKPYAEVISCSLDAAIAGQGNLVHPTRRPEIRNKFYEGLNDDDYIAKLKVGLQLKERIKSCLPVGVTMVLKRILK